MLQIKNVCKSFGHTNVLTNISCEVQAGTFLVLIGASGCGKTTLLNTLAGFTPVDAGEIVLDGASLTSLSAHQRPVVSVSQNLGLFPHFSARQNIAFGLRKGGRNVDEETLVGVAQDVGLTKEEISRKPRLLSGGQQQRVALARALAAKPKMLLMDEPLAHVDVARRGQLRRLIRETHEQIGGITIYVTHDRSDAFALSDQLGVLEGGRLLQLDASEVVYDHPKTLTAARLLGSVNVLRSSDSECEIVRPMHVRVFRAEEGANATVLSSTRVGDSLQYEVVLRKDSGNELCGLTEAPLASGTRAIAVIDPSGLRSVMK